MGEEERLYCRLVVEGGAPALQARAMTEAEQREAYDEQALGDVEWEEVTGYFPDDALPERLGDWLGPLAADAIARSIGADSEVPITERELQDRYLPYILALLRSAHAIGKSYRDGTA